MCVTHDALESEAIATISRGFDCLPAISTPLQICAVFCFLNPRPPFWPATSGNLQALAFKALDSSQRIKKVTLWQERNALAALRYKIAMLFDGHIGIDFMTLAGKFRIYFTIYVVIYHCGRQVTCLILSICQILQR